MALAAFHAGATPVFALQAQQNSGAVNPPQQKPNQTSPWVFTAGGGSSIPGFSVGGLSLILPSPTGDMNEVGNEDRTLFNLVVPNSNRLVAAYLPAQDLAHLRAKTEGGLSKYALVEALRSAEFSDIDSSDFSTLVNTLGNQMGSIVNADFEESEAQFNRRMKTLKLNEKLSLGKPVMLGLLFTQKNAVGFGMITPVTINGVTKKMVMATILLRVRQRLLFAYVFAQYKDEQTADWTRKTAEQWTDAILVSNQEPDYESAPEQEPDSDQDQKQAPSQQ
jgi:hypothetical protein